MWNSIRIVFTLLEIDCLIRMQKNHRDTASMKWNNQIEHEITIYTKGSMKEI